MRDAGKEGFGTRVIQEMRDVGKKGSRQEGCRTEGIQNSWDAGQVGRKTGMMQDLRGAGKEGCRKGRMQVR